MNTINTKWLIHKKIPENALKHNVHILHVSGATMHTIIAHKGIFNSIQHKANANKARQHKKPNDAASPYGATTNSGTTRNHIYGYKP